MPTMAARISRYTVPTNVAFPFPKGPTRCRVGTPRGTSLPWSQKGRSVRLAASIYFTTGPRG